MIAFLSLLLHVVVSPFKTKARLEAEIIMLRHQLNVLRQRVPSKPKLTVVDRLLLVWLYRLFPSVLNAVTIIQPETIIRWHRTGFRLLCLPNTTSDSSDDEARQGLAARQAGRTAGSTDSAANPYPATDAFGVRCNSGVGCKDSTQMRLAKDDDVIKALSSDRTNQPLRMPVLPG